MNLERDRELVEAVGLIVQETAKLNQRMTDGMVYEMLNSLNRLERLAYVAKVMIVDIADLAG